MKALSPRHRPRALGRGAFAHIQRQERKLEARALFAACDGVAAADSSLSEVCIVSARKQPVTVAHEDRRVRGYFAPITLPFDSDFERTVLEN